MDFYFFSMYDPLLSIFILMFKMPQIWPMGAISNCLLTPFEMSLYPQYIYLFSQFLGHVGHLLGLYLSNRAVIQDKSLSQSCPPWPAAHADYTSQGLAFPQLSCTIRLKKKKECFSWKDAWNSDRFKLLRSDL